MNKKQVREQYKKKSLTFTIAIDVSEFLLDAIFEAF